MKVLISIFRWILFGVMMMLGLGCAANQAWIAMALFLITGIVVSPAGKEFLGKINPGLKNHAGLATTVLVVGSFGVMFGTVDTTTVAEREKAELEVEAEAEPSSTDAESQFMEVHFIDVGQGDATLVKCGGFSMLIDAGDDSKGTTVQNYLKKQGVEKLDYLLLTHPDADHIGGAPVIITKFDIDTVFISNYEKDNKTYLKLIQALDDRQVFYSTPEVGDTYMLGGAEFTILAPNGTYEEPNNASIALLLQNGDNRFLFTGDAEEKAEEDILEHNTEIRADVYKVGHHGANTSSTEAFLEKVQPEFAVISCAEGNVYGHPHAQTLNTLRSMGVKVFRTDEQGSIVAESDGTEVVWNCAPSETWQAGEPTQNSQPENEAAQKPTSANEKAQEAAPAKEEAQASTPVNEKAQTPAPAKEEAQASTPAKEEAQVPSVNEQPQVAEPVEEVPAQTENVSVEVHVTKTGKKYHSAGCQYLSKSDIPISLEEAKSQGYEPCSKCNPPR